MHNSISHFIRTANIRLPAPILLLLILTFESGAQPVLTLKRLIPEWPTIELYFQVGCSGQPVYDFAASDFKIFENGKEQTNFKLWCPDPSVPCSISAALVFDVSGSMAGALLTEEKQAGLAFLDLMDGVKDQASVIEFHSNITILQEMTEVKPMLAAAINQLATGGASLMYDGLYAGLEEVVHNGKNQCRAVILITDGDDNISQEHKKADCIGYANRFHIHIFTIGIGNAINSAVLQDIAQETGGMYYEAPGSGDLAAIYQDISIKLHATFEECVITYEGRCMDGSERIVDFRVVDYCGGTDQASAVYTAPKDTSTYTPLSFGFDKIESGVYSTVTMPLKLTTKIDNDFLNPFTADVLFDESGLQFVNITTPPGSLLEGIPIITTICPGGFTFTTSQAKWINGSGKLAELTFRTGNPFDTTCYPLTLTNWRFNGGCFKPDTFAGQICIIPPQPFVVSISGLEMPDSLVWQKQIKDYVPNPFSVSYLVQNLGVATAVRARYKITVPTADLKLISPASDTQTGAKTDLGPNEYARCSWTISANRRITGDSIPICITARFDNQNDVSSCRKLWVPAMNPLVSNNPIPAVNRFDLAQNKPNPFNRTTIIEYELGEETDYRLTVYNPLGQIVSMLVEGHANAGKYSAVFDGRTLPGGLYVYKLETAKFSKVMGMLLTR